MDEHSKQSDERRPTVIEKLTIPGRVLLLATVLLFGSGFYFSFFFVADNFPPGQYPLVVVLMPTCIGCFFFFLIAAWLLERCGIQIYADKTPK